MGKLRMIYLFTDSFPYGVGEQFLETEVRHLASRVQLVVLIPYHLEGNRRALPDGVEVDTSLAMQRPTGIPMVLRSTFASIRCSLFYKELATAFRAAPRWKALKRVIGFLGGALRVRNWVLHRIRTGRLKTDGSIFYTYWVGPQTLGIGLVKSRYPNTKVISRAHGHDLYEERRRPPYLPFRRSLLALVDRVFTVSDHGRRYLRSKYPQAAAKCDTSRLGVSDPGFATVPSLDGVLRIVSCSFLVRIKRVDRLVVALGELASLRPALRVEWHHFGNGPQFAHVERLATQMLPATVRWFLHGQCPPSHIMDFYREHPVDVFVNVSASEGIPVSIMEAQSCGIPVIATAVGGTPEIVNVHNGILVDVDADGKAVARALAEIAKGRRVAEGRRMASKKTWEDSCHAERNYDAFVRQLLTIRRGEARKPGERVGEQ